MTVRVGLNGITEPTPRFGSRVYLWDLASALAETEGVELILLVGRGDTDGIPPPLRPFVRELPIRAGRSYRQIFQQKEIRRALLKENVNVYHVPNTAPVLSRRIPTVVTIHDLVDLRMKKYGAFRTFYRFLVNFLAAHRADRVLTVSENSKKDIIRLLRVPESKVSVIYNGVGEEFRPLNREECKSYLASRYSIKCDFILAPGGLSKNKNNPRLLSAMRILREGGRQEVLVLLGDPKTPGFAAVEADVRRHKLEHCVVFPGFVPRQDLPTFYNAASVVAYPTLYEGFGLPVLEAMACGTPVVTGNNSSLPEVAGDAAWLVNTTNEVEIAFAIQSLLTDEGLRTKLSSRGVLRARQFTWNEAALRTAEVFLNVAAKSAPLY